MGWVKKNKHHVHLFSEVKVFHDYVSCLRVAQATYLPCVTAFAKDIIGNASKTVSIDTNFAFKGSVAIATTVV